MLLPFDPTVAMMKDETRCDCLNKDETRTHDVMLTLDHLIFKLSYLTDSYLTLTDSPMRYRSLMRPI